MHNPQILQINTINADWCDKDIVMLHACFQLLTDFVEKEISQGIVDWEQDENTQKARIEINDLYVWWKQRANKEATGMLDPIWKKGQYENDNDMLVRLIKIRQYLWT